VQVQIFADTICPWCFIGKRRFERALEKRGLEEVDISWEPYQLNPDMPPNGISRDNYMALKFGSIERVKRIEQRLTDLGIEEDIRFNFEEISSTPNTWMSHKLIQQASGSGVQSQVVELIYQAYFLLGKNIGNPKTLLDIGAKAGLEMSKMEFLSNHETKNERLNQADSELNQSNISGIPWFVINDSYAISGAQLPEVFVQIFDLVRQDELSEQLVPE